MDRVCLSLDETVERWARRQQLPGPLRGMAGTGYPGEARAVVRHDPDARASDWVCSTEGYALARPAMVMVHVHSQDLVTIRQVVDHEWFWMLLRSKHKVSPCPASEAVEELTRDQLRAWLTRAPDLDYRAGWRINGGPLHPV